MFETLGSYSRQNFHISMQNGSHLEISWKWNFDSHLRIKIWHFQVFPYVCIGKPCINAFAMFAAHALREGRGHARTLTCDDPLPSMLIMSANFSLAYSMWYIRDNFYFFFCLVCCLKKNKTAEQLRLKFRVYYTFNPR